MVKKFSAQQMTQSLEDYLEAIYILIKEGRHACVRDVARHLNVKMPSVVKAIHELKKLGLVTQEPYAPIELTPKGKKVAGNVLDRHTLLRGFLERLGVGKKNADNDACMMEHFLSAETLDKIKSYMAQKGVEEQ